MESEAGRAVWGKEAKAEQGGDGRGRQMGHRGSGGSERDVKLSGREAGNESGACYPGMRMNHAENELSHCDSE